MFKKILNLCGVVLVFSIAGTCGATTEDRLNQLIQKIEHSDREEIVKKLEHIDEGKKERLDQIENQILGRASWEIRCTVKVYENTKVCVMHKAPLTVVRIDNRYSVYIGENHQRNSMTEVRVDENKAVQTREGLYRDADDLLVQFKKGYYAFTRYQPKNGNKSIEHKVSLIGFTSALKDLEEHFKDLGTNKTKS